MLKLSEAFYQQEDVCHIAKELLGKLLVTRFNGTFTSGKIVETEAYNGIHDKASHAYGERRTQRTKVMYSTGGVAYVYLCYGIHHLFNVVSNGAGIPHAVLIRGIHPIDGIDMMLQRMNRKRFDYSIGRGPGNVSKALGINTGYTGYSLTGDEIFIADIGPLSEQAQVVSSPRIGVDYAGEDAKLLYRFYIRDSPFVSGSRK